MGEVRGPSSVERKGWDWGLDSDRVSVSLLKGLPQRGDLGLESCKQSTFQPFGRLFPSGTQDLNRN